MNGDTLPSREDVGWWPAAVAILVVAGLVARVMTLPQSPDEVDSVLFLRGVSHFSIRDSRPHWPGYPVYIWAGKLFGTFTSDAVRGLHLLSACASALTAWPLAVIGRAWTRSLSFSPIRAAWTGLAAGALWLASPMGWVTASQIVSDPLGLLLGVTCLALWVDDRGREDVAWTCGAALAGLMLGVRLVNVTMFGPMAWKAWHTRRQRWWGVPPVLVLLASLAVGVLPWATWLATRPRQNFVWSARDHLSGHFSRWGESLLTDPQPLTRPLRAARTLALYGFGAGGPDLGWARVCCGVSWAVLLASAARQKWRSSGTRVVTLWAAPQILYLFIAHEIATVPRYMFPAMIGACLLGGMAIASGRRVTVAAMILCLVSMARVSWTLAVIKRGEAPVEYQAAQFLARQPQAAVLADAAAGMLPFYLSAVGGGIPAAVVAGGETS